MALLFRLVNCSNLPRLMIRFRFKHCDQSTVKHSQNTYFVFLTPKNEVMNGWVFMELCHCRPLFSPSNKPVQRQLQNCSVLVAAKGPQGPHCCYALGSVDLMLEGCNGQFGPFCFVFLEEKTVQFTFFGLLVSCFPTSFFEKTLAPVCQIHSFDQPVFMKPSQIFF